MTYVTLSDGTPCRVDTTEGDAFALWYGERAGIGEERWTRMDPSSPECREAFLLAEIAEAGESLSDDAARAA